MKIKCPECGSTNIIGWRNEYCVAYYELDKDGFIDEDRRIGIPEYQVSGGDGYQCQDCNKSFRADDLKIIRK